MKELTNLSEQVPLYRIALALLVFFFFLFLRKIFLTVTFKLVRGYLLKTKTRLDDVIFEALRKPLGFFLITLGAYLSFKVLGYPLEIFEKLIKSLIIFGMAWAIYNLIVAFEEKAFEVARVFGKDFEREIGSFLIRSAKSFLIIMGILAILQEWGINVSALIASLGLGGLAIALASKDTLSNFFGGLTLLADKSIKVGDWIRVGEVEGIVEDLGLRTTKVRTFEKSLITVPNQYMATNPLENFSRRSVRRIKMRVGLTYSTPPKVLKKIVEDIREMLLNHPRISKEELLMVHFDEFEDSSLSIFIYCFTDTADWQEYLSIREDVNLRIMEIVERNGSSFAFPSRSIYLEKLPKELPQT